MEAVKATEGGMPFADDAEIVSQVTGESLEKMMSTLVRVALRFRLLSVSNPKDGDNVHAR